MRFRSSLSLVLFLFLCGPSQAQVTPSPAGFLGYDLGDRFTPHHRVLDYFDAVDAASDWTTVSRYGETYEGRPLVAAFVSTPENLARLDEIRQSNLQRAGLEDGDPSGDPVAIVWLSYNVHGNEAVSTEAAMATLFDLAGGGDSRAAAWLAHTVVVIDPCINPDGRDRYVEWYNRTVGRFPNADPAAWEHQENWPGGRTNHYWFDLNRDWSWLTQQETQARVGLYNQWMPQVHVDFHEQGVDSPYYFAPAAPPYHVAITPWQRTFQELAGRNHAGYFDAQGWLYFTEETFDLFYPGYGDTYPIFNGAVGMTYEQGGSGRAGLGIETAEGDTLRLSDRIAHHHTTSLSTVEVSAREQQRLLEAFETYFEDALTQLDGDWKTYVIKASTGRDRLQALSGHLSALGIHYGTVTRTQRGPGFDYATGNRRDVAAEPGDLVVSAYQPKSRLARVLLEPEGDLADSLTYDITAWSLPYAYGARAVAMAARVRPDADFVSHDSRDANNAATTGRPYAYVVRWTSPVDAAFLAELYRRGVLVRYATEPFEADGASFDRGTLLITRRGNERLGARFDEHVQEAAAAHGRDLVAVASGLTDRGPDLGSGRVRAIRAPRVAVAVGAPVSSASAGEIWHFFDQQIAFPVSLIRADRMGSLDLDPYDVLVLPSGSYGFTDESLDKLRGWVRAGGRLIALERAAAGFSGKEGFALKRRSADSDATVDSTLSPPVRKYADRRRDAAIDGISGAIYRATLDVTHPLAFGLDGGYYTLRRTAVGADYLEGERNWNVAVLGKDARIAGHVGHAIQSGMERTLVAGIQEMGAGEIVYFTDDPLYRAFWYNGRLLFANAVFMRGR